MIRRFAVALVLGLVGSTLGAAPPTPLDPEPNAFYTWRVVVRFDVHPLLSPARKVQIKEEVKAALLPAIGEVGRLEILELTAPPDDKAEPLLRRFWDKGFPALDGDEFRKLTGSKTHFLRIAVVGSGFKLESRQHDGYTGMSSPVVRIRETKAPETAGRLAGLMLARDFGPVGVIEPNPKDVEQAVIKFRGGMLPGFEKLVKQGDVFAVAAVREIPRPPAPRTDNDWKAPVVVLPPIKAGQPRDFTLLRVESDVQDGVAKCRVLTRFDTPFPIIRGVVGYRCLKLATVEGPVAVRVVDNQGNPPQAGTGGLLSVRASDKDFLAKSDAFEFRDGIFRIGSPLRHVACVVVSLGTGRTERFPVAILGEGPSTIRFEVKPEQAAKASFEREVEDLRGRVAETSLAQTALLQALARFILAGKNKDALERATAGLENLVATDAELTAELDRLRKNPGSADPGPAALLAQSARQLDALRTGRSSIEARAKDLGKAVNSLNDPAQFEKQFAAKELNDQIRGFVDVGEVPAALELYDRLIELTKDTDGELKMRKTKLSDEWKPKNEQHRAAREFVTGKWRTVAGLADYKQTVDDFVKAGQTFAANDDRLGLRNYLASLEPAYVKLKEILDTLDANSESDRQALKDLQTVSVAMRKAEDDARITLKTIEGPGKSQ